MAELQTISTDEAEEIVMGYDGHIATQDISEHRWYVRQLVVFERVNDVSGETSLLGFIYLKPASELQEDQDRFERDPVEVFPVTSREVSQTVYTRAKDA